MKVANSRLCVICLMPLVKEDRIMEIENNQIAHTSCACEVPDRRIDELTDDLGNDWNINT